MSDTSLPAQEQALETESKGFGCLETDRGRLPLLALNAAWRIQGLIAHGSVRQTFRNSTTEHLEATYIFPLPDRAAVTRFVMRAGNREVVAELREREEARDLYEEAIEKGHPASILEEERPEVFTIRVGNIPPGEDVEVELALTHPLEVTRHEATFRFPLVVAPRYIPGIPLDGPQVGNGVGVDTDEVPDASRISPPVLLPGFPNPVQLSLTVEIDDSELFAEGWKSQVECALHEVEIDDGPTYRILLRPGERLNRDFILRIPLNDKAVGCSFLAAANGGATGVFSVMLVSPLFDSPTRPVDVVFVLDRSGSMEGWKMHAARRAVQDVVDSLTEKDRFAILAFDTAIECFSNRWRIAVPNLVDASQANKSAAIRWLNKIHARGGTELGPALQRALALLARHSDETRHPLICLITDGQVAGEDAVLRDFSRAMNKVVPRVIAIGVDSSVNLGILRRLARLTGGLCDYAESPARLDSVVRTAQKCIRPPVLTDIVLKPKGWQIVDGSLEPEGGATLYPGQFTVVGGRFVASMPIDSLAVEVEGRLLDGTVWSTTLQARPGDHASLLALWGRAKVRALEDRYVVSLSDADRAKLEQEIVRVSLDSGVLCRFTALVAVERNRVTNEGGRVLQVVQPVELPEGWAAMSSHAVAYYRPFASLACPAPGFAFRYMSIEPEHALHAPGRSWDDVRRLVRLVRSETGRRLVESLDELLVLLLDYAVTVAADKDAEELMELVREGRTLEQQLQAGVTREDAHRDLEQWLTKLEAVLERLWTAGQSSRKRRRRFWA